MSYDGIKGQLKVRLGSLGLRESKESFDFEDASPNAYENTFIVTAISGELSEGSSVVGKFDDNQTWEVRVAYGKSTHSDIIQKDKLNRKITDIIKDLDNPTNWQNITNGAKYQRYDSWAIEELDEYYLVTITLDIIDEVIF